MSQRGYDQRWGIRAVQNRRFKKASKMPQCAQSAVEQLLDRPIDTGEEVVAVPPQKIPAFGNRALRVAPS